MVSSAPVSENKRVVGVVVGLDVLGKVIRIHRHAGIHVGLHKATAVSMVRCMYWLSALGVRSLWLFRCVAFVLGPGSW